MAVSIYNGYKSFGGNNAGKTNKVLCDFAMIVPKGSLYSLLGSSGCGKTTVLSCLVGLSKLDRGKVHLFVIPDVASQLYRVGYMPQEISLYGELSILETLLYFGSLFGETEGDSLHLKGRVNFLKNMLALPEVNRTVGTLSGGQRRRVSFAVALIHEPELLLLDEPTAGVDPLVRECIWKHLKELTQIKGTTVLVTTHYVDEAKQSDFVGIMRNGRLVAETSPQLLMENFGVQNLEDAFLAICRTHETTLTSQATKNLKVERYNPADTDNTQQQLKQITEMASKSFKILSRSIWMLAFILMVPAFCMFITCITFEHDAHDINLGVVNQEVEKFNECFHQYIPGQCRTDRLSCSFLREVPNGVIKLVHFESKAEALKAVNRGDIWGILYFPKHYSEAWMTRTMTEDLKFSSDSLTTNRTTLANLSWNDSVIIANLDKTNKLISGIITSVLYQTFEKSAQRVLEECGEDPRNGEFPLHYLEPIIGRNDMTSLHYIAPGLAIGILFFFPLTVSIRFISEKRQGTIERCIASGVKMWQILIAQAIPEILVLTIQSVFVFIILRFGFSIGMSISLGNSFLVLSLCILQGICGLALGFLLGLLCQEEGQAAMITIAIIFPNSFIAGILWPREGMSEWVQTISTFFPMTLPGEALRSIMIRQWDLHYENVRLGYFVLITYIILSVIVIYFIFKRTRSTLT